MMDALFGLLPIASIAVPKRILRLSTLFARSEFIKNYCRESDAHEWHQSSRLL